MNLDNTVCSPEWRICWLHLASQAYQDKDVEDYETKARMLIMMTVKKMLTMIVLEDLPDSAQSTWNTHQERMCAPKSWRLNKWMVKRWIKANLRWKISYFQKKDQRMNKSKFEVKISYFQKTLHLSLWVLAELKQVVLMSGHSGQDSNSPHDET